MTNKYPLLTSPIQLGRTVFRNRMFSAPMGAYPGFTADQFDAANNSVDYGIVLSFVYRRMQKS